MSYLLDIVLYIGHIMYSSYNTSHKYVHAVQLLQEQK